MTRFNETLYDGFVEERYNLGLVEDSLILNLGERRVPVKYTYNDGEKLVLNSESNRSIFKDHYIQIKQFNMVKKMDKVESFLTSNPLLLDERTDKVELLPKNWYHMGAFIQDSLAANYGYSSNWYLYSLGSELFFVLGNKLIHIKGLDEERLYGIKYGIKNKEIVISKSHYTDKWNIDNLYGKWKNNNGEFGGRNQTLEIGRDKIVITSEQYSDTLKWNLNNYKNKLFISNDNFERHGNYWKIEDLSNNRLVVERKINRKELIRNEYVKQKE